MAKNLKYISGSPLIGSPIIYSVQAESLGSTVSAHNVKVEVTAWMVDVDSTETVLTFSSPVDSGETVEFDISSALRAVADRYEYTAEPPTAYPTITYRLRAYDEYMQNGDQHKEVNPTSVNGGKVLMGAFSDFDRWLSDGNLLVQHFSRKPITAEMVTVGETMVIPQSYDKAQSEQTITVGPTSKVYSVIKEGLQMVGGRNVYVLPANNDDRYQFRFVNGLGVVESVSVRSFRTTEVNITSETYMRSVPERFNTFSRAIATKKNDYEKWKLSSGPLDESWQKWFIHEFLMSTHTWINIKGNWIPCLILADETVTGINRQDGSLLEVIFTVQLGINGMF